MVDADFSLHPIQGLLSRRPVLKPQPATDAGLGAESLGDGEDGHVLGDMNVADLVFR
jgi:hypothetical protein